MAGLHGQRHLLGLVGLLRLLHLLGQRRRRVLHAAHKRVENLVVGHQVKHRRLVHHRHRVHDPVHVAKASDVLQVLHGVKQRRQRQQVRAVVGGHARRQRVPRHGARRTQLHELLRHFTDVLKRRHRQLQRRVVHNGNVGVHAAVASAVRVATRVALAVPAAVAATAAATVAVAAPAAGTHGLRLHTVNVLQRVHAPGGFLERQRQLYAGVRFQPRNDGGGVRLVVFGRHDFRVQQAGLGVLFADDGEVGAVRFLRHPEVPDALVRPRLVFSQRVNAHPPLLPFGAAFALRRYRW